MGPIDPPQEIKIHWIWGPPKRLKYLPHAPTVDINRLGTGGRDMGRNGNLGISWLGMVALPPLSKGNPYACYIG